MITYDEILVPRLGGSIACFLLSVYWILTYPLRFGMPKFLGWSMSYDPPWTYAAHKRLIEGGFDK